MRSEKSPGEESRKDKGKRKMNDGYDGSQRKRKEQEPKFSSYRI